MKTKSVKQRSFDIVILHEAYRRVFGPNHPAVGTTTLEAALEFGDRVREMWPHIENVYDSIVCEKETNQ